MIVSVTRISKTLGGKKFYHFPIIKITSLLTILSFVLPYVGFAFTPANYPADPVGAYGYTNILGNGKKITIPNDFGDITSSFQGQQPLTVVCVQDLHCNFEVQQNMAGIIRNLAKKNKLKLIAVEGENQAIDVSQLSTIPVSSVRDQVGNYFLKRGMITGAEFQAALSDQPLLLHGIEEKAIYDQSKQLLNQFFNAETQGHCEDLRFALDDLKPAIYNESLAKIDHEHMAYEYNKISFNKFSTFLIRAAKEAQLDLTPYAALMDAIQNAKVANSKLYVQDHLIAQAEQLEKAVRQVHYTTNYQRNLDHYIEILDIIESMVNISATPAQLARFFKERQTFSVTNILEFIETASLELGETTFIVDDAMSLDQSMLIVEQFYQLVDKRSLVFVKKLMALMKAKQESLAVMVTGGFHTPIIEELLKKTRCIFYYC